MALLLQVFTFGELGVADGAIADLIVTGSDFQAGLVADAHFGHFGHAQLAVAQRLFPEQARDVVDPGLFHFDVGRLQDDGLVGLALAEPDLEAVLRVAHLGREANVRRLHALLVDVDVEILALGVAFRFGEEDQVLEEEDVAQALLAALPAVELALAQQPALFFDVDVAVAQRVHGQQVVAVAQLEAHHLLGRRQVGEFRLLVDAALLEQLLQQQRVLAHALHRLQQVTGQVHLVAQIRLLRLKQ